MTKLQNIWKVMLEGQLSCLSFTNTRLPSNDRRTTQTLPVDFHLRDFVFNITDRHEQTHGSIQREMVFTQTTI